MLVMLLFMIPYYPSRYEHLFPELVKGCYCAFLIMTTNASLLWYMQENVNDHFFSVFFSGYAKVSVQSFMAYTENDTYIFSSAL